MKFIHASTWDEGIKALRKRLLSELKDKHVVWLVCGGSNISAAVEVMNGIDDAASEHLTIFLSDERFGELGHNHSNAKQLSDAGFRPKQAVFVPVLMAGFSLEETKERYAQAIQTAIEHADVVIAQLGIGPDGHIAGILPHSAAVEATGWVFAYDAPPYTRLTLTFPALLQIDVAFSFVYGEDKLEALTNLKDKELSLDDQPSQILKQLPESYIYNDQLGGTS